MAEEKDKKEVEEQKPEASGADDTVSKQASSGHPEKIESAEEIRDESKIAKEPQEEPKPVVAEATPATVPSQNKFKAFIRSKKGKITLAIIGVVVVTLGAVFAIPSTRYGLLGLFIKKDVTLTLIDSKTGKPVSDAQADLPGQTAKSDNQGKITFKNVPVGSQTVTIKKKYFKDVTQTLNVWLTKAAEPEKISVEATGRQVPIKITNKVSGQVLEKAKIVAQESSAITDEKGEAVLILPADKATLEGKVTADGYNDLTVTVINTEQSDAKNTFSPVPAGKLYFLSKRTGKINVMKSDLDGANPEVVVQGTGREDQGDTSLLASRDWRYLMLKAKRDSDKAKLYIIDTGSGKMSVADEGDATFSLLGWADHTFVYKVSRSDYSLVDDGQESIKTYNAENGKLAKVDSLMGGHDTTYKYFGQSYVYPGPILLGNEIVYEKAWVGHSYNAQLDGKKDGIYSIKADGSNKKTIVEADASQIGDYSYRLNEAYAIIIRTNGANPQKSYEYENGKLAERPVTDAEFEKEVPTYLYSPSGNETFWSEARDGKNTLFLGDKEGKNGREIATLSEYKQYGWYSDNYLLLSKNGSELYIMAKDHPADKPLKITDYHKPAYSYYGYGGGYGGF